MSPDTLAHLGLTQEPFSKEIDDADLWLPPSKQAVLDELTDVMHARQSAVLTGVLTIVTIRRNSIVTR